MKLKLHICFFFLLDSSDGSSTTITKGSSISGKQPGTSQTKVSKNDSIYPQAAILVFITVQIPISIENKLVRCSALVHSQKTVQTDELLVRIHIAPFRSLMF